MQALVVEILAYAPTAFYHCQGCEIIWQQAGVGRAVHREQMESNLPAEMMEDYRALSGWVTGLVNKHGGRVVVRVVDAVSLEGFIKSLRYRVRGYPAVIVPGGERLSRATFAQAEAAIERRLAQAAG